MVGKEKNKEEVKEKELTKSLVSKGKTSMAIVVENVDTEKSSFVEKEEDKEKKEF